jgi:drug/metabolite transporter (DMT)-like permease
MLAAAALLLLSSGLAPGVSLAVPFPDFRAPLLVLAQSIAFSVQYLLFFVLQKLGGPVYLSLLGSVAAIVGVPVAIAVLGEPAPEGLLTGGLLIAGGIVLLTLRRARPNVDSGH